MSRVLFATAELSPMVAVGGLALATSGLVKELTAQGSDVTVVLPDYGGLVKGFTETSSWQLDVPDWCGPTRARQGSSPDFDQVILISRPGLERPHPYVDPQSGNGWPDNTERFFGFSAAIAALCAPADAGGIEPDLLHLNDWHTAAAVGFMAEPPPTVLTIHTLGYQGVADAWWMSRIPHRSWLFGWYDVANPLAAAIRTVDRVIAVSPNYVREILTPGAGMGMHDELAAKGDALSGILNGIDTSIWDPKLDPTLPQNYTLKTVRKGKEVCRQALLERFGWEDNGETLIGVVSRLVDQKGIDLLVDAVPYLKGLNARIVMLGSGIQEIADMVRAAIVQHPEQITGELDAYDEPLSHLIFAGCDLFCMPSRFEPCGLAQMQGMAYGTPTIATAVGGLVDTIIDADEDLVNGNGFLTVTNDLPGLVDALHRATRAFGSDKRFNGIRKRGMEADWSWKAPARKHIELYDDLLS